MDQTASSYIAGAYSSLTNWISSLPYQDVLGIAGLAFLILLPVLVVVAGLKSFSRISSRIQRDAAARAMKDDTTPGNKILIATVEGAQGRVARNQLMAALESRLPEFNFGAPFYMGAAPISIETTDFALSKADHAMLDKSFRESNADLIIWGDAGYGKNTTRLCFSTPQMLNGGSRSGFFILDLSAQPKDWDADAFLAIAYVAGKRLRPSLGRPSDFRAERFQTILTSMSELIDAGDVLTGPARTELEDDFAAGALHVGETLNDLDWLNKSVNFRMESLKAMKPGDDPVRWAQAKIDLGRAMCKLCETRFEPGRLQEAMAHIRDGIDSTKSDARMRLAETGFAALQRAEQMLADRRRFSIRWSV